MKRLNITKEQFNHSNYLQRKYGKLEYVSESGKKFKTNKGKILKFKESWNKDDYDNQPRKFRPKFDIGEKVSLTKDFYKEFHHYYNDVPEKFTKGAYYLDDIPEDGWIIEDVKTEDGIEGATGLHRPYYQYYITNLDMDSGYEDDSINGIWVYQAWIKSAEGSVKESTKKFGKKFNESADQTPEDIIDNIVTLSILSRDVESAETMLRELKQELFNMGLFSGQIHEDFDDFHDIAIDFAEHHNFNKQFVEQAAFTLKSEIEQGLSRGEFEESTKRFNESDERKECRRNILKAYDSMEQALRDYASILEGRQSKQAHKVEAKIHDIIAGFLADTSNSQGWVET